MGVHTAHLLVVKIISDSAQNRQQQMEAVEDHGVPEHKVNGTDNKSEM